jgi:hypothetical protein
MPRKLRRFSHKELVRKARSTAARREGERTAVEEFALAQPSPFCSWRC